MVSSTGYQYDLLLLMKFHNTRPARRDEGNTKQLIDPLTNEPFAKHDADYILEKARKKDLLPKANKVEVVKVKHNHTRFFPMPAIAMVPFAPFAPFAVTYNPSSK